MSTSTLTTTARNATLADLTAILQQQVPLKHDIVAPASKMRMRGGILIVEGTEPVLTEDGVTLADGQYRPTDVFDEGVSDKLGIPVKYLKRMRDERVDLYDANVNGWLHGRGGASPDPRSFLVRLFQGQGGQGIARALLSDSYRLQMDNLDALVAVLDGVQQAGVKVEIHKANLSERRMVVDLIAPGVAVRAKSLLETYRSPFTGQSGADCPFIHAGLRIRNSETGGSALALDGYIRIQVCGNGVTHDIGAMRAVHLGSKLEEGVQWSADTNNKAAALITAKARDAVATMLTTDTLVTVVTDMSRKAGKKVTDAPKVIETVAQRMQYTKEQAAGILGMFIEGGQMTAGGVMNAVTAYAQRVEDPDTAVDMESHALRVLDLVHAM